MATERFPLVPLRDLALVNGGFIGGPFGSSLGRRDYVEEGVPVVRGANLTRHVASFEDAVYVTDAKAASLARCLAVPGDIVMTQRGTLGQVAVLPDDYPRYLVSQSQMAVRVDKDRADPRFVLLALRGPDMARQIWDQAIVAGVPHLNLGIFKQLEVPAPPVDEQRRIASVLGTFDDKIESNRRLQDRLRMTASGLFQMARREESEKVAFGEIVDFHNRLRKPLSAAQRLTMSGDIPYYGATGVFDRVDRALFDDVLLLVGEDGSVCGPDGRPVTQYVWGPAWVNNHAHVLTGSGVTTEVALLTIEQVDISAWVTGAVQPKLSMKNLRQVPVTVPVGDAREQLEKRVAPLFASLRSVASEELTLRSIRDALLPKLVSGQIRVPTDDSAVEELVEAVESAA